MSGFGIPGGNASPSGSGSVWSPDGGMTQQFALRRLQRQQKRAAVQPQPGKVQPPPRPVKLKRY